MNQTSNRQVILVSGATGSVGGGAAVALAKRGSDIVLLGRSDDKLKARAAWVRDALAQAQVDTHGIEIATVAMDFSDMDSVREAAAEAKRRFPVINGLVLSVGVLLQDGPTILPNGHEVMFATNVLGPFLFTELLVERLAESDGIVLHVIAPFDKALDWDDLESVQNHKPMTAYNRTKTCDRMIAGELARRNGEQIASVAFDPTYVIDKSDPTLSERWPTGLTGLYWRVLTMLLAKHPSIAGDPIANLMLSSQDHRALNGALYKLDRRIEKPDRAMTDEAAGRRLWDRLVRMTAQAG